MSSNKFGNLFSFTTWGESHGEAIGCVIDGCPAMIDLCEDDIQKYLDRRRPGQSKFTTQRQEEDKVKILSGVFEGKTTGTPISLIIYNQDQRSHDYGDIKDKFRPSHADYTYFQKYGIRDYRGSGRASARETLARVAAGAVAKKYLAQTLGIEILSYVEQVGVLTASNVGLDEITLADIEANIVRCPDKQMALRMIEYIEKIRADGDSIGGVIRGIIRNVPPGLGEPVFDKINADLAKAMLSINAVKGFEIGSGFASVGMLGSEHNDSLGLNEHNQVITLSNNAGGVVGGITNGENIHFKVAFKPVSTIAKCQTTLNVDYQPTEIAATGRHDPCVVPRAVPIVDAMSALVIMDHYLRSQAYTKSYNEQ